MKVRECFEWVVVVVGLWACGVSLLLTRTHNFFWLWVWSWTQRHQLTATPSPMSYACDSIRKAWNEPTEASLYEVAEDLSHKVSRPACNVCRARGCFKCV